MLNLSRNGCLEKKVTSELPKIVVVHGDMLGLIAHTHISSAGYSHHRFQYDKAKLSIHRRTTVSAQCAHFS